MCDQSRLFIGIEIGGTKLQVVLGDAAGHIARRWRGVVDRKRGGPGIRDQLKAVVGEMTAYARPIGVAAGFGGPVDWRSGRICKSHQIDGWEGFELSAFLTELTGVPAIVDNDANVAALGEAILGAGKNISPVFYVTLGSGVGGGLVVDGKIYHGAAPGESEFGHLWLDRDAINVESRCSGWAVDRRIREAIADDPASPLARLVTPGGGEARHLSAALEQHDPIASLILDQLAADLGFALSHVVHLMHPRIIIVGGGLSLVGEPLRAAVAEALAKRIMPAMAPGPEVRLTALGEDAVPAGALVLAAQQANSPI